MINYRQDKKRYKPNKLGSLYIDESKLNPNEQPVIYIGGQMEHRCHIAEQTGFTFDPGHNMFTGSWFYDYPLFSSEKGTFDVEGFTNNFLEGLKESGLEKLIKASYSLLGLISYLTAGEDETRAWTIKKGTKAPQAAGKIHTDFERGFIRAEVVNYQDLLDCGSLAAAKEKGIVGLEGKEYVVKDGDVMLFRFNV